MTERLKATLRAGRDSAQLRFGLASALFARAAFEEALEHAEVAVRLDPDYSAAWRLLGRLHLETSHWDEAARAFEVGIGVAERRGDRQLVKEMKVFLARAQKAGSDNEYDNNDDS